MMKKIIVGTMLALPLAVTSLATKASAEIINPHVHRLASRPVIVARARHKVYIPAHWEGTGRHRHRVPGHYEWRN